MKSQNCETQTQFQKKNLRFWGKTSPIAFLPFLFISFVIVLFSMFTWEKKTTLGLTIVELTDYSVALYNGNSGVHVKKLFW